jgi:hypothetical protein
MRNRHKGDLLRSEGDVCPASLLREEGAGCLRLQGSGECGECWECMYSKQARGKDLTLYVGWTGMTENNQLVSQLGLDLKDKDCAPFGPFDQTVSRDPRSAYLHTPRDLDNL